VAAPPSDVTFVILFLIAIVSGIHFMVLKQRMTEYNGKLIKFCVENFGPSQGGSNEVRPLASMRIVSGENLISPFLFGSADS